MENEPISAESAASKPAPVSERDSNFSSGLLLGGAAFVVLGILVFISSSWQELARPVRLLVVLSPLILLNILGFATRGRAHLEKLSRLTIFTASIILPFILGFVLVQSEWLPWASPSDQALVIFLSSLVSVLWYLVLEFAFDMRRHALLTVIGGAVMGWSFASFTEGPAYYYSVLGILISYLFLSLSWMYDHSEGPAHVWQARVYGVGGVILGWLGLMSLPLAISDALHKADYIPGQGFVAETTLMYVAVSALFFFIAAPYGLDWLRRKGEISLTVRQVAENTSAIALTVPAVLAAFAAAGGDSAFLNTVLLLACGILAVTMSYSVRVATFRVLGYCALVLGAILFIANAFQQISFDFILALIILGLAMIVLAFFLRHIQYRQIWTKLWQIPSESAFGLGLAPERPAARPSKSGSGDDIPRPESDRWLASTRNTGSRTTSNSRGWWILLWVIGGIVVLAIILRFIEISTTYNRPYTTPNNYYDNY